MNILLFLTDDHGAWAMRHAGNREIQTPNLDRLALEGTRFSNAFTPCPVCSPARACLTTGLTPSQHGIHDWIDTGVPEITNRDWLTGFKTLPEYLKEVGYQTFHIGKRHLGNEHLVPAGVDRYFGVPDGSRHHNGKLAFIDQETPVIREGNETTILTDVAICELKNLSRQKPFFMQIGYLATHSPYESESHDPKLALLYKDATFSDLPDYTPHPWAKNEGIVAWEKDTANAVRRARVGYYAAVTEIDREVGRILKTLDEAGLRENTLVIYTSDHGCSMGQQGIFGKGNSTRPLNMLETSLRVPLILRGPGIPHNRTLTSCVDHYDTFCTLLELARANPPVPSGPGKSYHSKIQNPETAWDDTRIGEYGDLRMIRTATSKLIWRFPEGPHEYFDLHKDPNETTNRFSSPETIPLQQELFERYARFENTERSGLRVRELPRHNRWEAWCPFDPSI